MSVPPMPIIHGWGIVFSGRPSVRTPGWLSSVRTTAGCRLSVRPAGCRLTIRQASWLSSVRTAGRLAVIRPYGRPAVVRPYGRPAVCRLSVCFLYFAWCDIFVLNGGILVKFASQMFIMWAQIAAKVFKFRGRRSSWYVCEGVNAIMLEAYILRAWCWGSLVSNSSKTLAWSCCDSVKIVNHEQHKVITFRCAGQFRCVDSSCSVSWYWYSSQFIDQLDEQAAT